MQRIIQGRDRSGPAVVALVATFLGIRTAAAAPVQLDIEREIQINEKSCWAAVSVMAMRAFKSSGVEQVPQLELIFYREADIAFPKDRQIAEKAAALKTARDDCTLNMGMCRGLGAPWLFSLHSQNVPPGRALAPGHFRKEIKDRKRPVIIRWDYGNTDHSSGNNPETEHYLIVIGYDDTDGDDPKLLVWNPWPTAQKEAEIEAAGGTVVREFWMPYSRYLNPDQGDGLKAVHEGDIYKLRTRRLSLSLGYPALVRLADAVPAAPRVDTRERHARSAEGGGGHGDHGR
jgi:hypothetical protein